ncbi:MAG: pseudouridine synthase, partial [Ostreibacterium sp.]
MKKKQTVTTPKLTKQGKRNTSFKAVSKSAKGKHPTQNQAGAKKHFAKKVKQSRQKISASNSQEHLRKAQSMRSQETGAQVQSYGVRHLTIAPSFDGQRIDNYLRRILPSLPKSRLYQMLRKGEVRLNKKRVKAELRVSAGDILRIPPTTINSSNSLLIPERTITNIKKCVLYQDKHFMVINKLAGIAVHGGSKNEFGIIDIIRQAFPDQGWELCHRLDKETSGCLVLARSRQALNEFQQLSMTGNIHKQYLTLVKGTWVANELLIDTPLEKQTVSRMNDQGEFELIDEGGDKKTSSIFTTREHYAKTTLMQVVIKTGKTHQIRVHSAL